MKVQLIPAIIVGLVGALAPRGGIGAAPISSDHACH
jgi:hypothetical protein